MRDLVDAWSPRPVGMPLTDRKQGQDRPRRLLISRKNGAPLAGGSRDVELDAPSESGPVEAFLFTAPKPFTRNAVAAHLFYNRFDRSASCFRTPRKILGKHLIGDSNFEARTCTRAHRC